MCFIDGTRLEINSLVFRTSLQLREFAFSRRYVNKIRRSYIVVPVVVTALLDLTSFFSFFFVIGRPLNEMFLHVNVISANKS